MRFVRFYDESGVPINDEEDYIIARYIVIDSYKGLAEFHDFVDVACKQSKYYRNEVASIEGPGIYGFVDLSVTTFGSVGGAYMSLEDCDYLVGKINWCKSRIEKFCKKVEEEGA